MILSVKYTLKDGVYKMDIDSFMTEYFTVYPDRKRNNLFIPRWCLTLNDAVEHFKIVIQDRSEYAQIETTIYPDYDTISNSQNVTTQNKPHDFTGTRKGIKAIPGVIEYVKVMRGNKRGKKPNAVKNTALRIMVPSGIFEEVESWVKQKIKDSERV